MFTTTAQLQLITTFVQGTSKATVYLKNSTSGPTHVVTFERCFRDGETAWKGADMFACQNIDEVQALAARALAFLKQELPL